jgi:hypothetical protein
VLLALSLGIVAGSSVVYLVPQSVGPLFGQPSGGGKTNCPALFSWVSIRSADGFVTYSQPHPGGAPNYIPMLNQYVLKPGTSGYLTMVYFDIQYPLNDSQGFKDYLAVADWTYVSEVNGTGVNDLIPVNSQEVGISVSIHDAVLVNSTYGLVTYQITASPSAIYGTYLVRFRDLCLGELVTIGNSLNVEPFS